MLTDGELAQMRAIEEMTMVERATITNYARTGDNTGGTSKTPSVLTNVPCRRMPARAGAGEHVVQGETSDWSMWAGAVAQGMRWEIDFPAGTAVYDESQITIGNEKYEVVTVKGPETYELYRGTFCQRR